MKLYVGNLSWNTDEDALRDAFERVGDVEYAKVITDYDTGRSRGFGFVTFTSSDDATNAITTMDGTELDGRTIKVNEAKERTGRGNAAAGSRW
jgi:RNA recognition motif-containing protein